MKAKSAIDKATRSAKALAMRDRLSGSAVVSRPPCSMARPARASAAMMATRASKKTIFMPTIMAF